MKPEQLLGLIAIVVCGSALSCSKPTSSVSVNLKPVPEDHLVGSGATFPIPLYNKWVETYKEKNPEASVLYNPVGSSGGVSRFINKETHFGGSDAAMTDEEIAQVAEGVQLIPTAAGSVVIAYNLPEIAEPLKLSRSTYVDIFFGKITTWDDESIKQDNPDAELPSMPITVVTREDGSGTTFAFTNHLSAISEEWRDRGPGATKLAKWPMETVMGSGNEGAADIVKKTAGAISYIQYAMARDAELSMAMLENKAGKFVEPGHRSGFATLAAAELPDNLRAFFPDPEGADSYPIVTYTWLMLYKEYESPERLARLKDFVEWCLTEGQKYNDGLGYISLPVEVSTRALEALESVELASASSNDDAA